jgi:multiple sugar transport system substrate-binding protein
MRDQIQEGTSYYASSRRESVALFAEKSTLFSFGSTWDLPDYAIATGQADSVESQFTWDAVPLPHSLQDPIMLVQGSAFFMLQTAPTRQLASWLFLRWMLNPENDALWATETGALPLFRSSLQLPIMEEYLERNPHYAGICSWLESARQEPAVPYWSTALDLLAQSVDTIALERSDPEVVLSSIETVLRAGL